MGLTQIGASLLAALLVGALTRGTRRLFFLLALSVLAVYWFQPARGDAFGEVAAGRSVLHPDSLWDLAELLQQLRKEASHGV